MWSAIRYAARVAPQLVVFESVTAAFNQGRLLMQALRDELEEKSGKQYALYHYKHNGLGVGGSSVRARYFFVASQVPFGVNPTEIDRVPSIMDSIGDLASLDLQWEPQEYKSDPSWWAAEYRSADGKVDGHMTRRSLHASRMADVHSHVAWEPGKDEAWAVKKLYEARGGSLPKSFDSIAPRLLNTIDREDFSMGFNGTMRWRPWHPGYVTTGDAGNKIVHPTEPRLLTARELARIQGYPDSWKIEPLRDDSKMFSYWGKNVNAKVGEHFGHAAQAALNGEPGEDRGELIGEREYLIDHSRQHKAALKRLLAEYEDADV
jgi:site-specific DNA-cytosine methylase